MNAAEQAISPETASKIAAIVNLFKQEFPDAKADLKPWMNDPDTRELVDPDSIDIGFHFPGWSPRFQSRSILVQIRLFQDPEAAVTVAQCQSRSALSWLDSPMPENNGIFPRFKSGNLKERKRQMKRLNFNSNASVVSC